MFRALPHSLVRAPVTPAPVTPEPATTLPALFRVNHPANAPPPPARRSNVRAVVRAGA